MCGNKKNGKWFVAMVAVIASFAFSLPQAGASAGWGEPATSVVIERQKILASDGAISDRFGNSVSISGDHAIVGAYLDDDNGSGSGSAYIFKWDGTSWNLQQKLTASDSAASDCFGYCVSISGDYAIVGAYTDDDNGSNSGSAYIFRWDGTVWSQQQKLLASDGAASDSFGEAVSISGDYAIVGSAGDDDKGNASGSAYIFKRDGTVWNQQQKLLASDGTASDIFGRSVAISGDYVIVGALGDDDNGSDSGSAYIFKRDGTSWGQQQKLLALGGIAGDGFGYCLSISGDYAIVGALYNDYNGIDSGSAYVFLRSGTSWSQQARLTASDGVASDLFGYCVSISGDNAIVGARDDDDNGNASGSAYIFKRNGTSWNQQKKLLASDGAAGDYFGYCVSMSGDHAIVGAYGDDDKGTDSGSAYIFIYCQSADINNDYKVDFLDFAVFADWWLYGTN